MALSLTLPDARGALSAYTLTGTPPARPAHGVVFNRIAYSAAHVVADPRAAIDPWLQCAVDWDTTIAYRRYLWSLGLGVAEAMDTAQRFFLGQRQYATRTLGEAIQFVRHGVILPSKVGI